jgi:IclR family transcriptional regulator, acetate operon repressor
VPPPEAWYAARAMQALEVLAFQPLSAPQVAAALQVHPRTARRLLNRLRDEGYLTRSDDARRLYAPSMRIVALAGQIVQRARLAERAVPFVAALHDETGAVAHLAIPSYRSVLCVVHGNGAGPAEPGLHELAPAHCTATGKALLGHRDAWRESVLSVPLERRTARTITDPGELRAEAEAIRARGYAIEDGENRPGVRGVAAPVFAASGEAVAALGVSTGAEGDLDALAARVLAAVRALETSDG